MARPTTLDKYLETTALEQGQGSSNRLSTNQSIIGLKGTTVDSRRLKYFLKADHRPSTFDLAVDSYPYFGMTKLHVAECHCVTVPIMIYFVGECYYIYKQTIISRG